MKKMNFKTMAIALAALTVGFTSCSKDGNNGIESNPAGESAALTIKVSNPTMTESKAFDAYSQQVAITDVTLFILDVSNTVLNKYWYADLAAMNTASVGKLIKTTTAAKTVYIVSNLGAATSTVAGAGIFTNVTTLQAAQAVTFDAADLALTKTPMQGSGNLSAFAPDGTDLQTASVSINMELIPARIDVTVNNNMKNYGNANAIVLDGVAGLYSAAKTYLVPTTGVYAPAYVAANGYYASGLNYDWGTASTPNPYTAADQTYATSLYAAWTGNSSTWVASPGVSSEPTEFKSQFTKTFYALPSNNGGVKNFILTVKGTFPVGVNNGDVVYYPVHFTTADLGYELLNGHRYNMTINLNGDAASGNGGGGVPDPETPVVSAYITVTIIPAEWVPVTPPLKEFN